MTDVTEFVLFHSMLQSLDSAFMALQGNGEWSPEGWGERFFTTLKEDHSEWSQDITSVYETARRMLLIYTMRRPGDEFAGTLCRNPRGFVRTVLHFVEGPTHSLN